jgi:ubiquinone/menaquinone biosynthesis C-methylase UbiE
VTPNDQPKDVMSGFQHDSSYPAPSDDWFHDAFDDEYRAIYGHRDSDEARRCINLLEAGVPNLRERKATAEIFDLCCGAGRHAAEAAARGYSVLGLDLSPDLLKHAHKEYSELPLVRGDKSQLPFDSESFDVVMNLFTSFGYFLDDNKHLQTAEEMARVLKPRGYLLWDHINPTWLRANIQRVTERTTPEGFIVRESRTLDHESNRVNKTIKATRPDGSELKYVESVRFFEPNEAKDLFEEVGFQIENRFGDYFAEATFSSTSPRQIILFRKM